MKITLIAMLLILSTSALSSIVPERIVTPLLDIFNKANKAVDANVEVMVTTYNKRGELKQKGSKAIID